jgi:hypothetical protein
MIRQAAHPVLLTYWFHFIMVIQGLTTEVGTGWLVVDDL